MQVVKSKDPINVLNYASSLSLGKNGIWYASETEPISYPRTGNNQCFEIEDNSFWFNHRNKCINQLVNKFSPKSKGPIFDLGGGNGVVAKALIDAGWNVVLVEPGKVGVENAKNRGLENVICATIKTAGLKKNSLPAVAIFDVLEHIEFDVLLLKELWSLLAKESYLYITVPAYNLLWSQHDIHAGHFRRYQLKKLLDDLKKIGFKIHFGSYIFRFLPLIALICRSIPFQLGACNGGKKSSIKREHAGRWQAIYRLLDRLLTPEINNIRNGQSMKFGLSIIIAAYKPI